MDIPTFGLGRSHLIIAVLFLLIGGVIGYRIAPQSRTVQENFAPTIELPSGGHVAERKPDEPVPPSIKQASKELKKAGVKNKVARAGSVTVKPTQPDCDPVKIDWGLVKQDDKKGNRMIFYTEDGTIISATDIPVETMKIEVYPRWSAGVIASVKGTHSKGLYVERHFGKLDVGLAAMRFKGDGVTVLATAGVSW